MWAFVYGCKIDVFKCLNICDQFVIALAYLKAGMYIEQMTFIAYDRRRVWKGDPTRVRWLSESGKRWSEGEGV